jgi:hypothetical protein
MLRRKANVTQKLCCFVLSSKFKDFEVLNFVSQ